MRSNERWAMDLTHIDCGADGWGHFAAVIDCHDRELVGYEFARRGRAKEAERALEAACIERFGTLRPDGPTPVVRSDNGLIFQSRRFRAACRDYRLRQEFITPYTPEQNGIAERFFRSLKEECVCEHSFPSFVKPAAPCGDGSGGTTSSVRTRRLAISARASTGRNNFNVWLDRGGALQLGRVPCPAEGRESSHCIPCRVTQVSRRSKAGQPPALAAYAVAPIADAADAAVSEKALPQ